MRRSTAGRWMPRWMLLLAELGQWLGQRQGPPAPLRAWTKSRSACETVGRAGVGAVSQSGRQIGRSGPKSVALKSTDCTVQHGEPHARDVPVFVEVQLKQDDGPTELREVSKARLLVGERV